MGAQYTYLCSPDSQHPLRSSCHLPNGQPGFSASPTVPRRVCVGGQSQNLGPGPSSPSPRPLERKDEGQSEQTDQWFCQSTSREKALFID